MIPFPKEPEYEYESLGVNPNLYVTMPDYVSMRIWANNTYPWLMGSATQNPYNIINYASPWIIP